MLSNLLFVLFTTNEHFLLRRSSLSSLVTLNDAYYNARNIDMIIRIICHFLFYNFCNNSGLEVSLDNGFCHNLFCI